MRKTEENDQSINVYFFKSEDQTTTRKIQKVLTDVQKTIPFKLIIIDPEISKEKPVKIPYVKVGPYKLEGEFRKKQLLVVLNAARDRYSQLSTISVAKHKKPYSTVIKFTFGDRFSLWWAQHYVLVICLIFFIYVGLPFIAPILMKVGQEKPAKVIYSIYSPLCHQLAFRSYFLFGAQPVYPRVLAGLSYPITWDTITGSSVIDFFAAKNFVGDSSLGYKVAICERDIAMYGSFLIFGIVFGATKKRIKPISFWIWLVLGVLPIAIDGTSQFSGIGLDILKWLPPRESTPLLRTITGILFGFLSGWYMLPLLEQTVVDTRIELLTRLEAFKQAMKQS